MLILINKDFFNEPAYGFGGQVGDMYKWGKGNRTRLRFSKSGNDTIEKLYATHYVSKQKIDEAKKRREAGKGKPDSPAE